PDFGVVVLENRAGGIVDLDELIDVGCVERAVMQGKPGRRVQPLDPLPLEHLAVGGQPRDEAVAVLLHDGAVDVADVDDAGSRILYDGFRLSQALGFPEELRPSGGRGADDQGCSECDDDGAHGPPRQMTSACTAESPALVDAKDQSDSADK